AYGVNIAHSGTVVGILIDKFMNDKKMIDALCESNINSVYNKIYTQNIINGGIKGEIEWNT
ncbi:cobalamin biosynthesis protein, partial [Clostridioides difficile]|nr:cobalamin biosynthesis protein [Clostridioides difficile]